MARIFNRHGKPLPKKEETKLLKLVDFVIKRRLVSYLMDDLDDLMGKIDLPHKWSSLDLDELSQLIIKDIGNFEIKDRSGTPLYYILLKHEMEYWFKKSEYDGLKRDFENGNWTRGWVPDISQALATDFEESYALVLLWLNSELKKFGTTVPEIENSINENNLKNSIKKILKEQIVKKEHEICSVLTCDKLTDVLGKIDKSKLDSSRKSRLENIVNDYNRVVKNNLKDVPKSGGLKGATGDSTKDFCDEYLSEIQTLICEPMQE